MFLMLLRREQCTSLACYTDDKDVALRCGYGLAAGAFICRGGICHAGWLPVPLNDARRWLCRLGKRVGTVTGLTGTVFGRLVAAPIEYIPCWGQPGAATA